MEIPYSNRHYIVLIIDCVLHYSLFFFLRLVNACILSYCCINSKQIWMTRLRVALENERFMGEKRDWDRIAAVKASFATGH